MDGKLNPKEEEKHMEFRRRHASTVFLIVLTIFLLSFVSTALCFAQASSALRQFDEDLVQIVAQVKPAVVTISTAIKGIWPPPEPPLGPPQDDPKRHHAQPGAPMPHIGSGIILSPNGNILTNAHVIEPADEIHVTLDDKRSFKAEVVGTDRETDIAVLKIKAESLPTITFGDSDQVHAGQIVLAIGTHFGIRNLVTIGVVSRNGISNMGILDYENFIVTDTKVNPGSGGSPLVNLRGEVVGVNSNAMSPAEQRTGLCFSLPSNLVKMVTEELITSGKVRRALLGVNIQDLTMEIAKLRGLTDSKGALISQVVPGSSADKAGIKSGDIVIAFNDRPVSDSAHLKWMIGMEKPGTSAKLSVLRDKETMEITVLLEERAEKGT